MARQCVCFRGARLVVISLESAGRHAQRGGIDT